jgi:hypothetical protein
VSTKLLAGVLLTIVVQVVCADDGICDRTARQAEADPILLVPRVYFAVTGSARLFFYTAPDQGCRLADTFVIAGDTLIGYSEFKGWTDLLGFFEPFIPIKRRRLG